MTSNGTRRELAKVIEEADRGEARAARNFRVGPARTDPDGWRYREMTVRLPDVLVRQLEAYLKAWRLPSDFAYFVGRTLGEALDRKAGLSADVIRHGLDRAWTSTSPGALFEAESVLESASMDSAI